MTAKKLTTPAINHDPIDFNLTPAEVKKAAEWRRSFPAYEHLYLNPTLIAVKTVPVNLEIARAFVRAGSPLPISYLKGGAK